MRTASETKPRDEWRVNRDDDGAWRVDGEFSTIARGLALSDARRIVREHNSWAKMREALQFTSGVLDAFNEDGLVEQRRITFTGDHEHLGTVSIGEVLDMADEALGAAKASGDHP